VAADLGRLTPLLRQEGERCRNARCSSVSNWDELRQKRPVAHTDSFMGVYFTSCRFTSG
jgi:hypothetical protein